MWKFFIAIEERGKVTKAKCIKWDTYLSAKPSRLRAYLAKCNSINSEETLSISKLTDAVITSKDPYVPPTKCAAIRILTKMNSFTIMRNSQEKFAPDEQIARLFYACNLPFNLAEHVIFKQTISMHRPGIVPPSREDIAGPLVEKIYEEVNENCSLRIRRGKCYFSPRWMGSDIHNTPVIAHSVHTGERSYFVNLYTLVQIKCSIGSNASIASLVIEASLEATERFGCKVVAVVTDNEKKMQSSRSKWK